jgi:putative hydrolase of the HAD superfamily
MRNKVIIFDLDDTLFKEIDFLKSAYREIAHYIEAVTQKENVYEYMLESYINGENVFENVIEKYALEDNLSFFLAMYRNHFPNIKLDIENQCLLNDLKNDFVLGLITDGRTITQENKISALGLNTFFRQEDIIISEKFGFAKPSKEPFVYFERKYPNMEYIYVGDNLQKDFVAPNLLGWDTICLIDDGRNIHKQNFNDTSDEFLPKKTLKKLTELTN